MITWQINKPLIMSQENIKEILDDIKNSRIKTTKVLLDKYVFELYKGSQKKCLPIVPGSFSIGILNEFNEENSFDFVKGGRVFVSALGSCGKCLDCITSNNENCTSLDFAGRNVDGVLKDFIIAPNSQIHALPNVITDKEALLIDYVSLAIASIDKLDLEKGQHVTIIGNDFLTLILCQLIIYYKGIPILVTDNDDIYNIAEDVGVYYKLKSTEEPQKDILSITGGRMCSKIIYQTSTHVSSHIISTIASPNASVVMSGFNGYNINLPLEGVMNKQLVIYCVKNGFGEEKTAINLIATKALDLNFINFKTIKFNEVEKYLKDAYEKQEFIPCIVNFIDL